MNRQLSWALAWLAWAAPAAMQAYAGEPTATVEARLIYGTNTENKSKEEPVKELESRLKRDFGYKHYRLLSTKSAQIKEGYSEKLDLGHQIEISIKHKGTKKQFHTLAVDLYHQNKWLLFLEVSVQQKSEPIFIKGPWTEQGLVIIAVTAK